MPIARSSQHSVLSSKIVGNPYSTTFPLTETPISESAIWTNGGATGIDFQNVNTTGGNPGIAFGAGTSTNFNDCLATLQNRYVATKHYARGTVHRPAGYTPPDSHEVELLIGFTISANIAKGYECTFGWGALMGFARWNGALNDVTTTVFTTLSGAGFTAVDGDDIRAWFDSSSGSPIITLYRNEVQQIQVTDTTAGKIMFGNPGHGYFIRPGAGGADPTKYCWKGWSGGDI